MWCDAVLVRKSHRYTHLGAVVLQVVPASTNGSTHAEGDTSTTTRTGDTSNGDPPSSIAHNNTNNTSAGGSSKTIASRLDNTTQPVAGAATATASAAPAPPSLPTTNKGTHINVAKQRKLDNSDPIDDFPADPDSPADHVHADGLNILYTPRSSNSMSRYIRKLWQDVIQKVASYIECSEHLRYSLVVAVVVVTSILVCSVWARCPTKGAICITSPRLAA